MKYEVSQLQHRFRTEMGLILDQPKTCGFGTSNDGNTARRFFSNPEKSAEITGLSSEAIKRCAIILQVISSEYEIKLPEFSDFCASTANYLVKEYNWYYLPISVHKILCHGPAIVENAILPIGMMSEEAQESKNKDVKNFREFRTRKMSRIQTNTDLIQRLLISSDPLISSKEIRHKNKEELWDEAKRLLILPEVDKSPDTDSDTDSNCDEDDVFDTDENDFQ